MLASGLFTFVVIAPKSAVMKESRTVKLPHHFDARHISIEALAARSSPNCVKTLFRTMFTLRRIHNRFIVFTESFKERSVWCHSNKVAKSIEALLAFFGFCSCSQECVKERSSIPIQNMICLLFALICLFSLLFHLQPKTSSDNLGDAIQFLREFDHEAAEMCNR